jgi:hypothetical protein
LIQLQGKFFFLMKESVCQAGCWLTGGILELEVRADLQANWNNQWLLLLVVKFWGGSKPQNFGIQILNPQKLV